MDVSCTDKRNCITGITDLHRVKCLFLDRLFLTKFSLICSLRQENAYGLEFLVVKHIRNYKNMGFMKHYAVKRGPARTRSAVELS